MFDAPTNHPLHGSDARQLWADITRRLVADGVDARALQELQLLGISRFGHLGLRLPEGRPQPNTRTHQAIESAAIGTGLSGLTIRATQPTFGSESPHAAVESTPLEQLWSLVEQEFFKRDYGAEWNLFLQRLKPISFDGRLLTLSVSKYVESWVRGRMLEVIEDCAAHVIGHQISVQLTGKETANTRGLGPNKRGRRTASAQRNEISVPNIPGWVSHQAGSDTEPQGSSRQPITSTAVTVSVVPNALLAARSPKDAERSGRIARIAHHPSLNPGSVSSMDRLLVATMLRPLLEKRGLRLVDGRLAYECSLTELWRSLRPAERAGKRPRGKQLRPITDSIGRVDEYLASCSSPLRFMTMSETGDWIRASEHNERLRRSGSSVRVVLEQHLAETFDEIATDWLANRRRIPPGFSPVQLPLLRHHLSGRQAILVDILDRAPVYRSSGSSSDPLFGKDAGTALRAGEGFHLLELPVDKSGERVLVQAFGFSADERPRRIQREVIGSLLRLAELVPERFGTVSVVQTTRTLRVVIHAAKEASSFGSSKARRNYALEILRSAVEVTRTLTSRPAVAASSHAKPGANLDRDPAHLGSRRRAEWSATLRTVADLATCSRPRSSRSY